MSCNAAGEKGPPLIIFKEKSVWDKWVGEKSFFHGTTYAATENGWMEKGVFINYFEKSFLKSAKPTPENPVILVYDGHSSHIDLKLVEQAKNNNVTIILLPPHSSHLLHPLYLAVFKSIKTKWDDDLCAWTRKHQGQKLPKCELSNILCNIWTKLSAQIIKNGFEKGGIYPFKDHVIDKSKFDPERLKRWVNRNSNQDSSNSQEIENNHTFNLDIVRIEPQET